MIGEHGKTSVFQRPREVSRSGWGSIVNNGNLHAPIFARRDWTGLASAAHFRTSPLSPVLCVTIRLTVRHDVTVSAMSVEDYEWAVDYLPIIGERFPVEFANSRYLHAGEMIDFLATPELIRLWFERVPAAAGIHLPSRITSGLATDLQDLRDATHHLLHALARPNNSDDVDGNGLSIATINRHAASVPSRPQLSWPPGATPEAHMTFSGGQLDVLRAEIASTCIKFVGGPEAKLVRCCSGNGCSLLFVQNHHKRRFCHESCSHRTRQARYHQSNLTRTAS